MNKFVQKHKYFLGIVLIFFLLRLFSINQAYYGDEFYFHSFSYHTNQENLDLNLYHNYPVLFIPSLFYKAGFLIFGDHEYSLRIISLLFNLGTLILIYAITRRELGENEALFSSLIYVVVFWSVFVSTRLDYDSSFLVFFIALFVFFLLDKKSRVNRLLVGSLLAIVIYLKLVSIIYLAPTILVYYLFINNWKIKNSIIELFKLGGYFIFAFLLITTILVFVLGADNTLSIFTHYLTQSGSNHGGVNLNFLIQSMIPVLLLSPLMLLAFLSFFDKDKKLFFFKTYFLCIILFFVSIMFTDNQRPLERYISPVLFPISILAGVYLAKWLDFKKNIVRIGIYTLSLLLLINLFAFVIDPLIIDFYPKSEYVKQTLGLNINLQIPLTTSIGPIGFYIPLFLILLVFTLGFLLFLIISFIKKTNFVKQLLIIFLVISLSYNIFLAQENAFSIHSPDTEKVFKELVDYVKTDCSDCNQKPIYVFRQQASTTFIYLADYDIRYLDFQHEYDSDYIRNMTQNDDYVLILDFPQINKKSQLWIGLTENCQKIKEFRDKGTNLGYVFKCSSVK